MLSGEQYTYAPFTFLRIFDYLTNYNHQTSDMNDINTRRLHFSRSRNHIARLGAEMFFG